jgi:hypothetical protein
VNFVRRRALESHVRTLGVVPSDEELQFAVERAAAEGHDGQQSRAGAFERADEAFHHGNASPLTDRPESLANTVTQTPPFERVSVWGECFHAGGPMSDHARDHAGPSEATEQSVAVTTRATIAVPITDVLVLREENVRWRLRFWALCGVLAFLLVVSIVQFSSTFIICRMLHETQEAAERLNQQNKATLQQVRDAQDRTERAARQTEISRESVDRHLLGAAAEVQESQKQIVEELVRKRLDAEADLHVLDQRLANELKKFDVLEIRQKLATIQEVWHWHFQEKEQIERRQKQLQELDEQIEELQAHLRELIAEKEELQQSSNDVKYHSLPGPKLCPRPVHK